MFFFFKKKKQRFDREIGIPLPTAKERIDILKFHLKYVPLHQDVNLGNFFFFFFFFLSIIIIIFIKQVSNIISTSHSEFRNNIRYVSRIRRS